MVVENDLGEPVVVDDPVPLLGRHDEAWKVTGALTSALIRREDGWALTSRQEIHPDDHDGVGELIAWLVTKAHDRHRRADGSVHVGWTRFYEDDQHDPLRVVDGGMVWP